MSADATLGRYVVSPYVFVTGSVAVVATGNPVILRPFITRSVSALFFINVLPARVLYAIRSALAYDTL